jgi:tRNA-guanine transglycosylase
MTDFSFTIVEKDTTTAARLGVIHTPHGDIETPAFVPVGTQGSVKSLFPADLHDLHVHLHFVNTYHMVLRPGLDVIAQFGGLHAFMGWDRPLITDSGGFQVFSLGTKRFAKKNDEGESPLLLSMNDDGVKFRSHWDGKEYMFTPEFAMQAQVKLGSDIHIAFDDCTAYPVTAVKARESMERTHRWAERSLVEHRRLMTEYGRQNRPYQALYGSVQGSVFEDLRNQSAQIISSMDFDGIAIGGVSVGESKAEMRNVLDWVSPFLPDSKPRHLLGVGEIDDIFMAIEHGMDTFDCVNPTRIARMGIVYSKDAKRQKTEDGKLTDHIDRTYQLDLTKVEYADDMSPIDSTCTCVACQTVSRAYLHHLFKVRELSSYRYATIHNIHFIQSLVADIRTAIKEGTFLELQKRWL